MGDQNATTTTMPTTNSANEQGFGTFSTPQENFHESQQEGGEEASHNEPDERGSVGPENFEPSMKRTETEESCDKEDSENSIEIPVTSPEKDMNNFVTKHEPSLKDSIFFFQPAIIQEIPQEEMPKQGVHIEQIKAEAPEENKIGEKIYSPPKKQHVETQETQETQGSEENSPEPQEIQLKTESPIKTVESEDLPQESLPTEEDVPNPSEIEKILDQITLEPINTNSEEELIINGESSGTDPANSKHDVTQKEEPSEQKEPEEKELEKPQEIGRQLQTSSPTKPNTSEEEQIKSPEKPTVNLQSTSEEPSEENIPTPQKNITENPAPQEQVLDLTEKPLPKSIFL
jgi:hypothetical protein